MQYISYRRNTGLTMKTIFDYINVSYSEYEYFKQQGPAGKVELLFQIYDSQSNPGSINLSKFFDSVKDYIDSDTPESIEPETLPGFTHIPNWSEESYETDAERVDVMMDEKTIMIESNSLKATRLVAYRFVESGYILSRDISMEKMFRKDKVTRYLRIFRIIDQSAGICLN